MQKITSFTIDHNKLTEGLYVSRIDTFGGEAVTSFDIRMKKPNSDDILTTTSAHTIEHIGATFLRNHAAFKEKVVYFGPMGCRTGFYLLLHGRYAPNDISELMKNMFAYIIEFEGTVPGASAAECGNFRDLDIEFARDDAKMYYKVLCNLNINNTEYPN